MRAPMGGLWQVARLSICNGGRSSLCRLANGRVMGVLGEAAQRFQVLIPACYPMRYRGLAGAILVNLEVIIRGGS